MMISLVFTGLIIYFLKLKATTLTQYEFLNSLDFDYICNANLIYKFNMADKERGKSFDYIKPDVRK